jgi:hypothetical protein
MQNVPADILLLTNVHLLNSVPLVPQLDSFNPDSFNRQLQARQLQADSFKPTAERFSTSLKMWPRK